MRSPPAISASGSRLPWTGRSGGSSLAAQPDRPSRRGRSRRRPSRGHRRASFPPAPFGKPMIGTCGMALLAARSTSRAVGAMTQRSNCGRGKAARPAVEQLHRIGAGLDLARQIIERDGFDPVDDRGERARDRNRPAGGLRPARGCPGRRPCRWRPSTGSRQSRSGSSTGSSCAFTLRNRLIDRLEPRRDTGSARRASTLISGGVRRGPSPATKLRFWPIANGTIRMSENRIAASSGEALQRLERDLGRGIAVVDQVEEAALVLAQLRDIREDSARPGASSRRAEGRAARL